MGFSWTSFDLQLSTRYNFGVQNKLHVFINVMLSTQRLRILSKFVCAAKHHILGLGVLDCQEISAILRRMQTVCGKISQITPYPKLPRSTLYLCLVNRIATYVILPGHCLLRGLLLNETGWPRHSPGIRSHGFFVFVLQGSWREAIYVQLVCHSVEDRSRAR